MFLYTLNYLILSVNGLNTWGKCALKRAVEIRRDIGGICVFLTLVCGFRTIQQLTDNEYYGGPEGPPE